MLETFTPAVCGSRKRQIVAQVIFSVAAVTAAAALGLALGYAGSLLGGRYALYVAAALALLGAAREAGLVRFRIPQSRRQVPEHWRFELPLPVWAGGYGAGLGAGFFTFQPFSTYWVACAGALALGKPVPAALCLSLYGAGRAAMIVWPRRRAGDPTAAVERLSRRRGALLRVNAVALVACAVLLGLAPTAGAGTLVVDNAYDPSVSGAALAFASRDGNVVVRPLAGGEDLVVPGAWQPSLSGEYLVYRDAAGIQVVRWTNGQVVTRIDNVAISHPVLDWPLLAYVRRDPSHKRLVVTNLQTGASGVHVTTRPANDLGRPALNRGRVAWHLASRKESRIMVKWLANGTKRIVARSRIGLLRNPAIYASRIAWADSRSGAGHLRLGWVRAGKRTATVETIRTRAQGFWTTSLGPGVLYSTRWTTASGAAAVFRTGL